jgi:hypothetical protein
MGRKLPVCNVKNPFCRYEILQINDQDLSKLKNTYNIERKNHLLKYYFLEKYENRVLFVGEGEKKQKN